MAILLLTIFSESASANAPVKFFEVTTSTTQAGGHPDIFSEYKVGNRVSQGAPIPCVCNEARTVIQNFPAGVIGAPQTLPRCTRVQLADGRCPVDSQVGVVAVILGDDLTASGSNGYLIFSLYSMVPNSDQAAVFAFTINGVPVYSVVSARTGSDYGLRVTTSGLPRLFPLFGTNIYLWGVPALPSHDALRFGPDNQGVIRLCTLGPSSIGDPRPYLREGKVPPVEVCPEPATDPHASSSPPIPFLSNPTTCSGPLATTLDTEAYDHGIAHAVTPFPAITGCDQLSFNPSLSAKPTTTESDSASGLDVDLKVPQFVSATTPSPSQIKATTITLPEGFSINPNAADGKSTCSDLEAHFGSEEAATCPEHAKIGTLTIDSSALPAPLPGYLYLGETKPGDRYRVILAADGFATHIKIAGSAIPDPKTGKLVLSFPDLPQSPLTEFNLHVFGSERGLLATPTRCGTYAVNTTFTPWDNLLSDQSATQFFTIDHGPGGAPCPSTPRPFSPSFEAGSTGNTAGAHSAFAVDIERPDGAQNLSGLTITTPPGFSATLKGIPYCPESAIATLSDTAYSGLAEQVTPACPAASQVGTAITGAGAGSRPLHVAGKAYLAGPYKGAPLSLVVVIPAVSGPYDLGNVAVRAALQVDPVTAQVTAISDPLPQILEGIPLRTRTIQVDLNRPNFTLNPTNCDPFSIEAAIRGDEGATQIRSSSFQAANCARLPYGPKLALRFSGGMKRLGHPAIQATFTATPGEANSKAVSVLLPKGQLLDNAHIGTVCTRVSFANETCPDGSLIGTATATTPLLDQPLAGNVYLRSNPEHELPDLTIDFKGQIDFTLSGHIDSIKERFRTRFEAVPDVPVSSFSLRLAGGSKGLLRNSESLCAKTRRATVKMTGQNGATVNAAPVLQTACKSTARGSRKHRRDARRHRVAGEGR
jgi:hypothetical protein